MALAADEDREAIAIGDEVPHASGPRALEAITAACVRSPIVEGCPLALCALHATMAVRPGPPHPPSPLEICPRLAARPGQAVDPEGAMLSPGLTVDCRRGPIVEDRRARGERGPRVPEARELLGAPPAQGDTCSGGEVARVRSWEARHARACGPESGREGAGIGGAAGRRSGVRSRGGACRHAAGGRKIGRPDRTGLRGGKAWARACVRVCDGEIGRTGSAAGRNGEPTPEHAMPRH
jgi:hypothetical protein